MKLPAWIKKREQKSLDGGYTRSRGAARRADRLREEDLFALQDEAREIPHVKYDAKKMPTVAAPEELIPGIVIRMKEDNGVYIGDLRSVRGEPDDDAGATPQDVSVPWGFR